MCNTSPILTYIPPPYVLGRPPASRATNIDLRPCHLAPLGFFHVRPCVVNPSFLVPPRSSLSIHLHIENIIGSVLPFLTKHVAIPSQSSLSGEGCEWFNVGFSPDVVILDVVLLCLAYCPCLHSHLSDV